MSKPVPVIPDWFEADTSKARPSFSRKRSKKLLRALSRFFPEESATALAKVFWFFFSKKNGLPSMCQPQDRLVSAAALHPARIA